MIFDEKKGLFIRMPNSVLTEKYSGDKKILLMTYILFKNNKAEIIDASYNIIFKFIKGKELSGSRSFNDGKKIVNSGLDRLVEANLITILDELPKYSNALFEIHFNTNIYNNMIDGHAYTRLYYDDYCKLRELAQLEHVSLERLIYLYLVIVNRIYSRVNPYDSRAEVAKVSIRKLETITGITRQTIYKYVDMMQEYGLIRYVYMKHIKVDNDWITPPSLFAISNSRSQAELLKGQKEMTEHYGNNVHISSQHGLCTEEYAGYDEIADMFNELDISV